MSPSSLPSRGAVPHLPDGVTVDAPKEAKPRLLIYTWTDRGDTSWHPDPWWSETGTLQWGSEITKTEDGQSWRTVRCFWTEHG